MEHHPEQSMRRRDHAQEPGNRNIYPQQEGKGKPGLEMLSALLNRLTCGLGQLQPELHAVART